MTTETSSGGSLGAKLVGLVFLAVVIAVALTVVWWFLKFVIGFVSTVVWLAAAVFVVLLLLVAVGWLRVHVFSRSRKA